MHRIIYNTYNANNYNRAKIDVLILADYEDDRALSLLTKLNEKGVEISYIIALNYIGAEEIDKLSLFPYIVNCMTASQITALPVGNNPKEFVARLNNINTEIGLSDKNIIVDISCMHIPEIFTLLKFLKMKCDDISIEVAYSFPFDYNFPQEPFTSFSSYDGDLQVKEMPGFSGSSERAEFKKFIVFFGFEGLLTKKVVEDATNNQLLLVNSFPSYYLKYKDISIINNYDLVHRLNGKIAYVPADNPFEVYNFLEKELNESSESYCVAPLSTKLVALGVCLYALKKGNVRVVYPVPEAYNLH